MNNEVKRVPCKNKNCNKTILELTAKKTGGYCYPCYNAVQAEKRKEYIIKNRKDINLYEGISDPVEVIKIMHQKKEYNPLITYIDYPKTMKEMYAALSEDDVWRLKRYAMELYKSGDDEWQYILLNLVYFRETEIDVDEWLKALVNDWKVHEPLLFRGTSDNEAEMIIEKLRGRYNPLMKYDDHKKTKEEMYAALSTDDIKRLKKYAMELYKKDDDKWQDILLHLVCFRGANIDECLKVLITDCKIYEPSLFKNASDDIAKLLIAKLKCKNEDISVNHILISLAMIGNDRVVKLFNEWKEKEPEFSKKLYLKPYEYSFEGGWKLDSSGKRKNLYYKKSYGVKKETSLKSSSVSFFDRQTEKCEWCKRKLTFLFTIDLHDENMNFLNLEGNKISIAICENCSGYYGTIFTNVDTNGNVTWSEYNTKPEYLDACGEDESEEYEYNHKIYIDDNVKTENYAANQFLDVKFTKIGGMPTWIQDAEYPKCPKCGEEMMFVGQVSMEDFEEYGEGIYYGFLCTKCKIAATTYQQT